MKRPCVFCEEAVGADEQDPHYPHDSMHVECGARAVIGSVGHLRKRCHCYGGTEEDPPGLSRREAARAAYKLFLAQGTGGSS